jgi:hypothetical protein
MLECGTTEQRQKTMTSQPGLFPFGRLFSHSLWAATGLLVFAVFAVVYLTSAG